LQAAILIAAINILPLIVLIEPTYSTSTFTSISTKIKTIPSSVITRRQTKQRSNYLSTVERQIIAEMNRIRQNPRAYAIELRKLRTAYRGAVLKLPGAPPIKTREGVKAVNEAIAVLYQTKPRNQLRPSLGLSLGARDHARDLGKSGRVGHYGQDGSNPFSRINRYGTWGRFAGENISYSPIHSARWHVMQLIIDDGVSNRGHREAILRGDYQFTGVACAPHKAYRHVCVITYAATYQERLPR